MVPLIFWGDPKSNSHFMKLYARVGIAWSASDSSFINISYLKNVCTE